MAKKEDLNEVDEEFGESLPGDALGEGHTKWRKVQFINSVSFPIPNDDELGNPEGAEFDDGFHLAGMPGKLPQRGQYIAGKTYILPDYEAKLWTEGSKHQNNFGVVNATDLGPAKAPKSKSYLADAVAARKSEGDEA